MNRRGVVGGALAAGLVALRRAGAQDPPQDLPLALSGNLFAVAGGEVRLADILAPALREGGTAPEPYADRSRLALAALLSQDALAIEDILPADRWGRRVAKVTSERAAPETIQETLVAAGAARVNPESDDHDFIRALLALEAKARADRRGLWATPAYAVFDARAASGAVGAFSLVEGVVVATAAHGGRVFLNFGEDYRTDFTASVKSALARRWSKAGLDLLALAGARLRVRGHVAWINGPSIALAHLMQVETVD